MDPRASERPTRCRVRKPLGESLAAASAVPGPEERTDADSMYEAMLRWNGEPAVARLVDRLDRIRLKKDAVRSKKGRWWTRSAYVRAPSVEHASQKPAWVRQEDRDMLDQAPASDAPELTSERLARRASSETRATSELMRLRRQLAAARARRRNRCGLINAAHPPACRRAQQQPRRRRAPCSSEPRKRRRARTSLFHTRNAEPAHIRAGVSRCQAGSHTYCCCWFPCPRRRSPRTASDRIMRPPSLPSLPPPAVEARRHGRLH